MVDDARIQPPLPLVPVDEIIARLEAARASLGAGVLVTDADGTLWDGDVGDDIFQALVAVEGVRAPARAALLACVAEIGITDQGQSPTSLARSLYAAFMSDRFPHDRALAMVGWVFAGWRREEVRAFAEKVLDDGHIEARIRPEMRQILGWAEAHGVPIYMVSASPIAIVEAGAGRLGVTIERGLGMTPAVDDSGVILPHLDGPIVYGDGKLRAIEAAGVTSAILGAFGDSSFDAAMLRAAKVPVAVTPAPQLREIASTIPGLVELRRSVPPQAR